MERSCLQCKKAHRKCDRKKPCCSLCQERGKQCEYDNTNNLRFEPYKPPTATQQKSPQNQHERTFHYVPQPQHQQQASVQTPINYPPLHTSPYSSPIQLPPLLPNSILSTHVTTPPLPPSFTGVEIAAKQHTIDAIFEVQNMYSHMPLFPKARLQQIVKYVRATETKVPYDGPIPPSDELALVYSMQSQTFKIFGQCTISKRFHEKAYSLLFNYMDTALNNFVIIATFVHLAFPLICDAEIDRARFYLENVRTFISLRLYGQGQPQLEQRERFLKQLYFLATNNLLVGEAHKAEADATSDLTRVVKSFMYSHCLSRQHHLYKMREESREEEIRDWVSPVLYDDYAKYMNLIRDDLIMSTDKFHIDMERMEIIAKSFKEMHDSTQNGVAFVDVAIKRLQYVMVAQAARIQQLERAGKKQKALPIADYITELTNNACYKYSTPIISVAVVVAANMHLEFGKMDMLKRDAAALAILRSRYEIVAIKYGTYIDMIEGVFRKFGEQEQVEDLSASLCSIKSGNTSTTTTSRMQRTPTPGQFASSPPQQPTTETYSSPEITVPTGVDQFLQVYLTEFETPDDIIFLSFNEM